MTPSHPPPRRSSSGFALIELIVVMIIIAVLMAIAIPSYNGAKHAARKKAAHAAAASYQQAIAAYMMDHGNSVPKMNTPEWPMAEVAKGPKNDLFLPSKPYMKGSIPDDVSNLQTSIGTAMGGATAFHSLVYNAAPAGCAGTGICYEIAVYSRRNLSAGWGTPACFVGNTANANIKPC